MEDDELKSSISYFSSNEMTLPVPCEDDEVGEAALQSKGARMKTNVLYCYPVPGFQSEEPMTVAVRD